MESIDQVRITEETTRWIKNVVVACNFCPFANQAMMRNTIRYQVVSQMSQRESIEKLVDELKYLDAHDSIETTFIIFADDYERFSTFLTLVSKSESKIENLDYEGTYQIASFHPLYCFADSNEEDAANYTNRSPYPMLHLLRESSISKALLHFPHPENIPSDNIQYAREKGLNYMRLLRSACIS